MDHPNNLPNPNTQPTQPDTTSQTPAAPTPAPSTPAEPSISSNTQPTQPTFDTEELKSQITNDVSGKIRDEVSKSVITKIGEALGLTKQEAEEKLPTDPKELAKFVQENAKKGAEQVLTERERAQQEEYQKQQEVIQQGAQRYQQLWRGQYNELAESGRVPKVANPDDPQDPGNQARVKILTKLSQIIKENQTKGVQYVPTLKEVFYEFPDVLSTTTIAGANTPISGGGRTMAQQSGMPYDQLHKSDFGEIVKQKYNG